MQYMGGTPSRKRARATFARIAGPLRQMAMSVARRRNRLARSAIAARVHVFKRLTNAFGVISGVAGTSTLEEINIGSSPTALMINGTRSASEFQAGTYQWGGALQFMLSHVSNVSEITNLFDNYRIRGVKVTVTPGFNSAEVVTTMNIPTMHYAIDTDDAAVPSTRIAVQENSTCRSRRLDSPFSIYIKPRAQNVIAAAAGSVAGGMLPAGQWIDTASQSIPHYGLKFWIDEFPTAATAGANKAIIKFTVTYYLECKNVT